MTRSSHIALLATLGALLVAAPASATSITIGGDDETASAFDLTQAIRERVLIPQPGIDQDGDGVDDKIAIEIERPMESGPTFKVPAIIDPSPYFTTLCRGNEGECIGDTDGDGLNDRWPLFLDNFFVPRGYAVILAESNGTGNSTGCPLHGGPGDVAGMKSVIDWLNGRVPGVDAAGNPVLADWHNGKAAMIGKSYDGTLTNAVAATGVDGLTTIVPESAISNWYAYSRIDGVLRTGFSNNYPATLSNLVTNASRSAICAPSRATLNSLDGDTTGDMNAFWDDRNYLPDTARVKTSVFVVHGLQDDNVTTDQFAQWWAGLAAHNVPRKMWLLREGHVDPFDSRRAVWVDTLHRWFDFWLWDVPNGIMGEPRVDIEDAPDVFNTYADWPLPGTVDTDAYLQGTTATNAGALGLSSGGNLDSLTFTDVPTQSETTAISTPSGAQTARRVFLSLPLTGDLRISGTPRVELEASLDKTQSNVSATLVDYGAASHITRNGEGISTAATSDCWGATGLALDFDACYRDVTKPLTAVSQWRVTRGMLDSSNRDSLVTPTPVTVGQPTAFHFPLYPQDYVFAAGHQIGVVVVGDDRDVGVNQTTGATITVDARASQVTLPIVGGYPAAVASGAFTPDTVAPVQALPADITVGASDDNGATVSYPAPGVTDNQDPSPTPSTCTPASGSAFANGTTTVTCTASDLSGNQAIGTFTVTVKPLHEPPPPPTTTTDTVPAPPPPTATESVPVPPAPTSEQPPATTATAPSAVCISKRAFILHLIRRPGLRVNLRGARILSVDVTATGQVPIAQRHGTRSATISFLGLPATRAVVHMRIRLRSGHVVTFARAYQPCANGRARLIVPGR